MEAPSPQSMLFDDADPGSGFAFDRSTFQRRASRDFGHRNRTTMGESSTPANILQLFAGTGLVGGHVAGEERHARRHSSALRQLVGDQVSFNDIQHLMSNVMQSGDLASSSARVDARTGSITLSISRRAQNQSGTAIYHPLFSVGNEVRRNERSSGFSSIFSGIRGSHLNLLGVHNINRENPPLIFEPVKAGSPRAVNVVKRRDVGPLVSDRRWGLDIGCAETCGSKIGAINTAVEAWLRSQATVETSPIPAKTIDGDFNNFFESFMGSLRNRGLSVTRGLIHEEMKEEPATLQESKEDEDFATVVNMSTGAEDPDFPLTQNLEQPAADQESKEDDDHMDVSATSSAIVDPRIFSRKCRFHSIFAA